MSQKQSLRQWVRLLKKSNPTTDSALMDIVKLRTGTLSRTGVMSLQKLVIAEIENDTNTFKTLHELFNILNVIVPVITDKPTRAKAMFGILRKSVKQRFPDIDGKQSAEYGKTYNSMRLSKEYYDGVREATAKVLVQKNTGKANYDGGKLLEILQNARSGDIIDNIILLQASSGARIAEITDASTFKKSPDKEQHVIQSGILKTRGEKKFVEKPLLYITPEEFIQRFKIMRGSGDNSQLNPRVNKRLKKLFGNGTTSHHLRKMYADLAYRVYADPAKISQSFYVSNVLGHDSADTVSANSYTVVNVVIDDINRVRLLPPVPERPPPVVGDIPHNLKTRDGKSGERLKKTIEALNLAGIPFTHRSLGDYGYGARVVRAYFKKT